MKTNYLKKFIKILMIILLAGQFLQAENDQKNDMIKRSALFIGNASAAAMAGLCSATSVWGTYDNLPSEEYIDFRLASKEYKDAQESFKLLKNKSLKNKTGFRTKNDKKIFLKLKNARNHIVFLHFGKAFRAGEFIYKTICASTLAVVAAGLAYGSYQLGQKAYQQIYPNKK